jgi:hypothetical protein
MTDCRRNGHPGLNDHGLTAFHAEVDRLMSLGAEPFAALSPNALQPLVATIRAIPSEVSSS